MRLAVRAAEPAGEPTAWALTHLGNLYWESGRLGAAERAYRQALARMPGYAPALSALATARQWTGRLPEAARLYRAAPRGPAAPRARHRPRGRARPQRAGGGGRGRLRNGLETALFDLDHDRNVVEALARARKGRCLRPSVEGEHVLAWALYKNGRCEEARVHSVRALRLGTKDWGAMIHGA
jgi:tetratricopeptide (TPR) repeat protein